MNEFYNRILSKGSQIEVSTNDSIYTILNKLIHGFCQDNAYLLGFSEKEKALGFFQGFQQ